jgi:uncharacterized RDD family membrane protein YckC
MNDQNSQSNPYAAPASVAIRRASDQGELAGRGRRLGAAIIDTIIMMAIAIPIVIVVAGGRAAYMAKSQSGDLGFQLIGALIGMSIFLLLNGYLLAQSGQTIGKKLLGTRVVRTDGSKADFARIMLRRYLPLWVVGMVPVVGMLIALLDSLLIFRASKKCLHDDIADTVVVRV